jgi:hypothetical protein
MSSRAGKPEIKDKSLSNKDKVAPPAFPKKRSAARSSGPRHVNSHIVKPGVLKHLMRQTDKLVRLNRIMRAYLPPHLQEHARLVAVDEQAWIIRADSSAWATRLRYALPGLRQQLSLHLKQDMPPLKLKVQPPDKTKVPEPRRLTLTEQSADLIEGAAGSVNDERLGAALMRLAAHARKAS